MKGDKELKKIYKLSLGQDNIITISSSWTGFDPCDADRIAEMVKEECFDIFGKDPSGEYSILVDLLAWGNKEGVLIPDKSRNIYGSIISHEQLKKIAFVTKSLFARVAFVLIAKVLGHSDKLKFFTSKKEAVTWLKEG